VGERQFRSCDNEPSRAAVPHIDCRRTLEMVVLPEPIVMQFELIGGAYGKLTTRRKVTEGSTAIDLFTVLPSFLSGISSSALLCANGIAAAPTPTPPAANWLPELGLRFVEELKKPEYALSRCMLTPVPGSDHLTVAIATDRFFSAGDIVMAVGGEQVNATAKNPIRHPMYHTRQHQP
jgi:hypothetical protein